MSIIQINKDTYLELSYLFVELFEKERTSLFLIRDLQGVELVADNKKGKILIHFAHDAKLVINSTDADKLYDGIREHLKEVLA